MRRSVVYQCGYQPLHTDVFVKVEVVGGPAILETTDVHDKTTRLAFRTPDQLTAYADELMQIAADWEKDLK